MSERTATTAATETAAATGRIEARFAALREAKRTGLVAFLTAGDPQPEATDTLLDALVAGGADLVELGMPFSDPMADGPSIQASSLRALAAGTTLASTLATARRFRSRHAEVPLIMMGYYNPVLRMGCARFCEAAAEAGVDGMIVVDLPPEEEGELRASSAPAGLCLIRLVAPTSDTARRRTLLALGEGFLYFVAIKGITGTQTADGEALREQLKRLRSETTLPVAVGFGLRSAKDVAALAGHADAVVVGSALVDLVAEGVAEGAETRAIAARLTERVSGLRAALDSASYEHAHGRC